MAQLPCIGLSYPPTHRHLLGVKSHLLSRWGAGDATNNSPLGEKSNTQTDSPKKFQGKKLRLDYWILDKLSRSPHPFGVINIPILKRIQTLDSYTFCIQFWINCRQLVPLFASDAWNIVSVDSGTLSQTNIDAGKWSINEESYFLLQ